MIGGLKHTLCIWLQKRLLLGGILTLLFFVVPSQVSAVVSMSSVMATNPLPRAYSNYTYTFTSTDSITEGESIRVEMSEGYEIPDDLSESTYIFSIDGTEFNVVLDSPDVNEILVTRDDRAFSFLIPSGATISSNQIVNATIGVGAGFRNPLIEGVYDHSIEVRDEFDAVRASSTPFLLVKNTSVKVKAGEDVIPGDPPVDPPPDEEDPDDDSDEEDPDEDDEEEVDFDEEDDPEDGEDDPISEDSLIPPPSSEEPAESDIPETQVIKAEPIRLRPGKRCDLNNDGEIDLFDVGIFNRFFEKYPSPIADIFYNGIVDARDFSCLITNWTGLVPPRSLQPFEIKAPEKKDEVRLRFLTEDGSEFGNEIESIRFLDPSEKRVTVYAVIDTGSTPVEVADLMISYDPTVLTLDSFRYDHSVFRVWSMGPTVLKHGEIRLVGGVPSGYAGTGGLLVEMDFLVNQQVPTMIGYHNMDLFIDESIPVSGQVKTVNSSTNLQALSYPLRIGFEPEEEADVPPVLLRSVTHPDFGAWSNKQIVDIDWVLDPNHLEEDEYHFAIVQDRTLSQGEIVEESLVRRNKIESANLADVLMDRALFRIMSDGEWTFHIIRERNGLLSAPSTYRVRIDTVPPNHFEVDVDQAELFSGTSVPLLAFFTTDDLSGLLHYRVIHGYNQEDEVPHGPLLLDRLTPGYYQVTVEAIDRAGNTRSEVVVVTVPGVTMTAFYLVLLRLCLLVSVLLWVLAHIWWHRHRRQICYTPLLK